MNTIITYTAIYNNNVNSDSNNHSTTRHTNCGNFVVRHDFKSPLRINVTTVIDHSDLWPRTV